MRFPGKYNRVYFSAIRDIYLIKGGLTMPVIAVEGWEPIETIKGTKLVLALEDNVIFCTDVMGMPSV